MADPRGRGFKRGKGKWRRFEAIVVVPGIDPASLGWQETGDGWQLNGYRLERCSNCYRLTDLNGRVNLCADLLLVETTARIAAIGGRA